MSPNVAGSDQRLPGDPFPDEQVPNDLLTVHVLGLPLAVQLRAQQHGDELTRELTLIGEQMRQQGNIGDLPTRLVSLIDQLAARYSVFTTEQEQQFADAYLTGVETIDVTYLVPVYAAGDAQQLGDILDEADEYCRAGKYLLTLATPADLVVYRHWFLDQFVSQAAGNPPVPWGEYWEASQGSVRGA